MRKGADASRLTCCITQTKTTPIALTLSPTNDSFAILSLPDLRLTTFNFLTGRLHRAYDESVTAVQEMQQAGTSGVTLDSMEFGRRLAVERELEKLSLDAVKEGIVGSSASIGQPVWDESGKFVLYPTLLGIKGELSLRASLPLRRGSTLMKLTVSRQHGYQQGRTYPRKGRDRPLYQYRTVSRRDGEEGRYHDRE